VYAARSFVDRTLGLWHVGEAADVARLLTSELVTNTIVHAHSEIDLRVHLEDHRLRVEVEDDDERVPVPYPRSRDAASGRGLQIVAGMAAAWGVNPCASGKVVWFEVPTGTN
jgi:anti-sigma regulatory factor (Ser/Thr protein kinase)